MTTSETTIRELPLRHGGDPMTPRLPVNELAHSGERMLRYRYPNGVTGWVTTTAEDFRAVLSDPRLNAKRFLGEPQPAALSVSVPEMPGFIPGMNGPEHLAVRRLASGDFSVKRIEQLRPYITQVVDARLDAMAAMTQPVDLIEAFCLPIPSDVIGHIIGVPPENAGDFQRAANETIGGRSDGLEDPDAAARAVGRLHEILGEVIEAKRANPGDDLVSRLISATSPSLSDAEIKGLCTNLLLAGHDTTAANTALGVTLLLTDDVQRAQFVQNPDRIPQAVEELIRFTAGVLSDSGANIPRLATEDVTIGGTLIRKGEWVMPCAMTANADAEICPFGADGIDLTRDSTRHLSFGYGAHTCLGQHLARAELQIMLYRLLTRFPTLELVQTPAEMHWNDEAFIYRMAELLVRW
jgi:cytochrome P450